MEQLEHEVAQFCFQSSRLFIQISAFMIESHLFRRLKFIYDDADYQAKIRTQVNTLKEQL